MEKKSRKFQSVKNALFFLLNFFLSAILSVFIRKFFINILNIEFLGLDGLFSNIFMLFSLADMGVSTVISYQLYRELANDNKEEVNMLMNIYGYIYLMIGIFISVCGIIISVFLKKIIVTTTLSWKYVYFSYFIQLISTLSSYFLAYRRTIFFADQKNYICVKIDTFFVVIRNVLQLFAILIFKSYILYAFIVLFINIGSNLIIYIKSNKDYTFLKKKIPTITEIRERNIFKDIKNFLIHKVANLIYFNTDNIIITHFLGLNIVGIVGNYSLISTKITQVLTGPIQSMVPSIGNMVYSEDNEKSYSIYKIMDMYYFFAGAFLACTIITCIQPFIKLFFGEAYLLNFGYIVCLSISGNLALQFENAGNFRSTFGKYEKDRIYMILASVINLVISIVLVNKIGIIGVLLGTIIGFLFTIYGRIKIVFKYILKQSIFKYILKHVLLSVITVFEIFFIYKITKEIVINNWFMLVLRFLASTSLLIILQFLMFLPLKETRFLLKKIKEKISKK